MAASAQWLQEQPPRATAVSRPVLREASAGLQRAHAVDRLHAAFGERLIGLDAFAAGPVDPIEYP
jgi:hypothetical protein